jgi:hypothetical protein
MDEVQHTETCSPLIQLANSDGCGLLKTLLLCSIKELFSMETLCNDVSHGAVTARPCTRGST